MASKEGFNEQLRTIQEKAKQLSVLKNDKTELFNQIDNLPREVVLAMEERYKNAQEPINTFRRNAADFILRGNSMTDEFIESQKSEQKIIHGEGVFRLYKKPFSIFYPFILLHKNQPNERELLIAFSGQICKSLGLSTDVVKIKIVDFTGSNNLGADWVWFAIYNATHKNQRTAKQLFFALSAEGIFYSFYNRLENKHVDEVNITTNEFDFDSMLKTYAQHLTSLREDIFKDQIVVKIPIIYKISHGTEVITHQQYTQLLERNLIIVHGDTPPLGKRIETQYDDFEAAEIGSLFYLCRSNQQIVLIGRLIGEVETCEVEPLGKEGWIQRQFEIVAKAKPNKGYNRKEGAWWLPNFPSTFSRVPERDFKKLDKEILLPFFDRNMESFYEMEMVTSDPPENSPPKEPGIVPFIITDCHVPPVLDIDKITKPLASIIRLMNDESGQMIGIFGSWGRGKTFFIKELLKREFKINYDTEKKIQLDKNTSKTSNSLDQETNDDTTFYFTKFHAWKYQDTEGVWAYLYQEIAKRYYSHLNKPEWNNPSHSLLKKWYYSIRKWINKNRLLFKLNTKRNGYRDIAVFFTCLLIVLIVYLTSTTTKDGKESSSSNLFYWILSIPFSTISGLAFINFFREGYKLGDRGKRLVQKYTHKPSFNKLLGIQAEIQDELKYLMKAWIKEDETSKNEENEAKLRHKKRLILFVDDIDRCNHDKIIIIVDALRVILEEPEIARRMIILMAVDETKLESAIIQKYSHLEKPKTSNVSEEKTEPTKMETTIHEYMDKLFISGIKLPQLTKNEVRNVLENYAKLFDYERNPLENDLEEEQITTAPDSSWHELLSNIDDKSDEAIEILIDTTNKKIKIYEYELECFESQNIDKSKTPRQLRIVMYRFLVAQLIINEYKIRLTKELKIYLANTITAKTLKDDVTYPIPEDAINYKPTIDKIIQMVVPY